MTGSTRLHVMSEADVRRAVARMAREIVELNGGTEGLVLMGIHRRGTQIAALIREEIEQAENVQLATGSIDITLYRDDLEVVGPLPVIGASVLPTDGIDDRCVVIVDDVAFTGRTARAALNEVSDWGRPRRILLCVLVDRGGRELPIQPDVTGREVEVLEHQRVEVLVPALDDRLAVEIIQTDPEDS
ncbi:MAG: bifunctional pyr operon transcriptional regulator/uracil phosphoribosyltransferase PyrR [Gemmatimonadota bacterium]|nr:bifunctional pyr operon transcriptional regulator/uracil phosphoribosyltransferase PyrR [Gemmatimonadota bacterium]MDH3424971.1 bifunctional pyr operon transcriptional regulator/uracil phosphoribosyltransferase PyrR [Gemmatimonadota bacterium]